jgi:hypothetical protein
MSARSRTMTTPIGVFSNMRSVVNTFLPTYSDRLSAVTSILDRLSLPAARASVSQGADTAAACSPLTIL